MEFCAERRKSALSERVIENAKETTFTKVKVKNAPNPKADAAGDGHSVSE